jgi:VWFA-related protein
MLRRLIVVLVACAWAQDRPTFHSNVSLVHADAEVLGKDGRVIGGLAKTDFQVFDEGRQQAITGFAAEEQPLDVILLFDVSGSMRAAVKKVAEAARLAFEELRRGDRIAIMTFNTKTRLEAPFTDDLDSVERSIQEVVGRRFGGGTFIQKAVDDAAKYFMRDQRTERRRAVLIITDNMGVRTRKEMSVVRDLWEADALLSGLIIAAPGMQTRRVIVGVLAPYTLFSIAGMEHIAAQTGGDTLRSGDPSVSFPAMMRRIRSRYSLYYPTPEGKPGSYRSIRVELTPEAKARFPEARVNARRGYKLGGTE